MDATFKAKILEVKPFTEYKGIIYEQEVKIKVKNNQIMRLWDRNCVIPWDSVGKLFHISSKIETNTPPNKIFKIAYAFSQKLIKGKIVQIKHFKNKKFSSGIIDFDQGKASFDCDLDKNLRVGNFVEYDFKKIKFGIIMNKVTQFNPTKGRIKSKKLKFPSKFTTIRPIDLDKKRGEILAEVPGFENITVNFSNSLVSSTMVGKYKRAKIFVTINGYLLLPKFLAENKISQSLLQGKVSKIYVIGPQKHRWMYVLVRVNNTTVRFDSEYNPKIRLGKYIVLSINSYWLEELKTGKKPVVKLEGKKIGKYYLDDNLYLENYCISQKIDLAECRKVPMLINSENFYPIVKIKKSAMKLTRLINKPKNKLLMLNLLLGISLPEFTKCTDCTKKTKQITWFYNWQFYQNKLYILHIEYFLSGFKLAFGLNSINSSDVELFIEKLHEKLLADFNGEAKTISFSKMKQIKLMNKKLKFYGANAKILDRN